MIEWEMIFPSPTLAHGYPYVLLSHRVLGRVAGRKGGPTLGYTL